MAGSNEDYHTNIGDLVNEGVDESAAGASGASGGFPKTANSQPGQNGGGNIWRQFLEMIGGDSGGPMEELAASGSQGGLAYSTNDAGGQNTMKQFYEDETDPYEQTDPRQRERMREVYTHRRRASGGAPPERGVSSVESKRYQR